MPPTRGLKLLTPLAVDIFTKLGLADPMQSPNAPAVEHQLHQGIGVVCRLVRNRWVA
jgi:hypothetical protein